MPRWFNANLTPGQLFGWASDMGVFRGPWPMDVPAVIPDEEGGEVDFIVAYPNPAHPSNPGVVGDGTYGTFIIGNFRYRNSFFGALDPLTGIKSFFGYYDYYIPFSGGAPTWTGQTLPGAHLYVCVTGLDDMTHPPPHPPSYYVPSTYTVQGNAKFQTLRGHWSSDQPTFDVTQSVVASSGGQFYGLHGTEVTDGGTFFVPAAPPYLDGDRDLGAMAASDLAAAISGGTYSPPNVGTGGGIARIHVTGSKGESESFRLFNPQDWNTDVTSSVEIAQESSIYTGSDFMPTPPALNDLDFDVDYASTPYAGHDRYMYNATEPLGYGWSITIDYGVGFSQLFGSPTLAFTPSASITTYLINSGAPGPGGYIPATADVLYSITLTPNPLSIGTISGSATIDLSTHNSLTLQVMSAPDALYNGLSSEAPDFPMQRDSGFVSEWTASSGDGGVAAFTTHLPTWRYWVPGKIAPSPPGSNLTNKDPIMKATNFW